MYITYSLHDHIQCSTQSLVHLSGMGKMMLRTGKMFCNHIEILYVTCPNILKIGIWIIAMESLGRTLDT